MELINQTTNQANQNVFEYKTSFVTNVDLFRTLIESLSFGGLTAKPTTAYFDSLSEEKKSEVKEIVAKITELSGGEKQAVSILNEIIRSLQTDAVNSFTRKLQETGDLNIESNLSFNLVDSRPVEEKAKEESTVDVEATPVKA